MMVAAAAASCSADVIQTGVQLTLDSAGFSAVHFLPACYQFEVYDTTGHTLTGKLSTDAAFQVDLNAPGVEYWPYCAIELSVPTGASPATVINNYFNADSSNYTLRVYGPNGLVHNGPVLWNGTTGFQLLGTFADLGLSAPGDYYLRLGWQQKPGSSGSAPYQTWEGTLLSEMTELGITSAQSDAIKTWLATHPPIQ